MAPPGPSPQSNSVSRHSAAAGNAAAEGKASQTEVCGVTLCTMANSDLTEHMGVNLDTTRTLTHTGSILLHGAEISFL